MQSSVSSPESAFWHWFLENHDLCRDWESSAGSESLGLLLEQLHRYDKELWFEVSNTLPDGSNELIITAEGVRAKFPKVERLVAAAPDIPGWTIIAFKQPKGFDFVHERPHLRIEAEKLWFLPLTSKQNPGLLGLRVAVPELHPAIHKEARVAVYKILETGLGEKVFSEQVHHVEVVPLPGEPAEGGYIELSELPPYIEQHAQGS